MMNGPVAILRSKKMEVFDYVGPRYEWSKGDAYLVLDEVKTKGFPGAILTYHNPPVHQIGTPGLDAYINAIHILQERQKELYFLILYFSNDPIHAGGDLKETLKNLDQTLEKKRELQSRGVSKSEIECHYDWADERLKKAFRLYQGLRELGKTLRILSVASGGTRYGGSAELVLMGDLIVSDSRSAICFSESLIGLIPGWGGIGRAISKAGLFNAKYLSFTAKVCSASELQKIGIYDVVVDIPFPFPRRQKTASPEEDHLTYLSALQKNNDESGLRLLPVALELAVSPKVQRVWNPGKITLTTEDQLAEEIEKRGNPDHYEELWNKPLGEAQEELAKKGRPLAPQSIEALKELFATYDPHHYDEEKFIAREMDLDASLYRDRRFRVGIIAALEQRVADFR